MEDEVPMRSEKVVKLEELWALVRECDRCMIAKYAKNKVFGDGNVSSPIAFLGEAPGMDEDRSGHTFVGRAGAIYSRALEAAGMVREEVFTFNVLKCHPPKEINPVLPSLSPEATRDHQTENSCLHGGNSGKGHPRSTERRAIQTVRR